ncbi:MAG TPA: 50S ribosomal protein L11 methyltransferase [Solirubrobacteraceae bacterium]|nr:50S ribosomal protein L11 methyltransferase [Solirubrobacteraceae bacterium]
MLRLAIRVRREDAELVLAELLELASGGVEEVDLGESIEYAVYGAPGELPALPDLHAAAGAALVEVSTTEIADDWAERWREFHRPLVIDGALTVRPPWEPPGATPLDVIIDPGQAFGTGAHASTRLCLELMLALAGEGATLEGAFLDVGCGSGVLAIVAARLGWSPAIAVDNDAASVHAAEANALENGVALDIRRLDLRRDPLPEAPTITANLLSPLLIAGAAAIAAAEPRRVIASGILVPEADDVARAFAGHGLTVSERRTRGDWAALLLARTAA